MSLLGRFRRALAVFNSTAGQPSKWFLEAMGGGAETASGETISPERAMRLTAVNTCVRVLAEDIAKLPLITYRRGRDGNKSRATDHPVYRLLDRQPNPLQTAFEWREMMQGHLELRGNAFSEIERDGRSRPIGLWPRHPANITMLRDPADPTAMPKYRWQPARGPARTIDGADMLHIRGLSSDGYMGLSPIGLLREGIGMAIAAERYGAVFFKNDAQPRGVLSHPMAVGEEARKNIAESFEAGGRGDNRHKIQVLEEGLKYIQIGMSNEDAQFLDTRKYQRREIFGFYRVPPHKGGDLEQATFSNIEQQALEYVTDALMGRLRRNELAYERALLTESEQGDFYIEHLVDALLRGDLLSRYQAYWLGRQGGWLKANDILDKENMNRRTDPGGEEYLTPVNMASSGVETQIAMQPKQPAKNGHAPGALN